MKTIAFLTAFFVTTLFFAQSDPGLLHFDKKYYEAVDQWVAFPKKQADSTYIYGFIYIDDMAGFSFRYKNRFQIKNAVLIPMSDNDPPSAMIISRLTPNTKLVHILNEEQREELRLPEKPKWLSIYKDSDEVSYLKNIGWHYNHIGAGEQALKPLLKAYKIEPHFKGLEFELAYAYNATGRFDEAVSVLKSALKNDPENPMFYRELGFAYLGLGKIEEAEKIYRKGIGLSGDALQKSEMAVNMAQAYFLAKNREKFDEWAAITRKHAEKGSRFAQFIDLFEKKWGEKR